MRAVVLLFGEVFPHLSSLYKYFCFTHLTFLCKGDIIKEKCSFFRRNYEKVISNTSCMYSPVIRST